MVLCNFSECFVASRKETEIILFVHFSRRFLKGFITSSTNLLKIDVCFSIPATNGNIFRFHWKKLDLSALSKDIL